MTAILGINDGHDASAALMIDGRIVAAAQEERFTGVKTDCGFPRLAIAACVEAAGIRTSDLDHVVVAAHDFLPVLHRVKREANFGIDEYLVEQHRYWKPKLLEKKPASYWEIFRDRADFIYDDLYPTQDLLAEDLSAAELERGRAIRLQSVARLLEVAPERTESVFHEYCHIAYGYYASHMRGRVLALTSESFGDESNATVSIASEDGIELISTTNDNNLGRLYRNMTLLLGMTPLQHEYKVMGLAPYANDRERAKSYEVFRNLMKLEGLNVVFDRQPPDLYFHFRDALEGHRFDGIAGALQQYLEEMLCRWLQACLEKTGLDRVIFSGGVAQNIKACKAMAELGGVTDFSVSPASGDTTLSMGACYRKAWELAKAGHGSAEIRPLDDIYLGPGFGARDVAKAIADSGAASRYEIVEGPGALDIARRLASGQILGRCCGRMEFGMRALGNRSILADPRDPNTVRKINDAIKFRDFWMPFTPTVLAERAADYIVNPKGLRSPYMTMAFDTTALARRELAAAIHPADLTARPQILERARNPGYYDLIKEFERQTGVGALLNTSFNLHGHPIVLGPTEALFTLDNSALDGVIFDTVLVARRA